MATTSASDVFLARVYQRLSGRPKKVGCSAVFIAVDFKDARMSEPYAENGFKSIYIYITKQVIDYDILCYDIF